MVEPNRYTMETRATNMTIHTEATMRMQVERFSNTMSIQTNAVAPAMNQKALVGLS